MPHYSPERRRVAEFELADGELRLLCEVTEHWGNISQTTAACGARHEYKVKQTVGVEETEKRTLEGAIKASLGLAGIGKFESMVKSKLGKETSLHVSKETEQSFAFEAPRCGTRTEAIYQLYRDYTIEFWDERWYHKRHWFNTLTERLARFHMQPQIADDPVGCHCNEPGPVYDQVLNCGMGRMSLLAGARKDVGKGDYRIGFAGRDVSLRNDLKAQHIMVMGDEGRFHEAQVQVPSALIPPALLFLAGETREVIPGTFRPYALEAPRPEPLTVVPAESAKAPAQVQQQDAPYG